MSNFMKPESKALHLFSSLLPVLVGFRLVDWFLENIS